MENPIKMDELGVPLFLETPIWNENISLLLAFWSQFMIWDLKPKTGRKKMKTSAQIPENELP